MKKLRSYGVALIVAALLAACGGGDPDVPGSVSPSGAPTTAPAGGFKSIVSFGDSLSDVGAYLPATSVTSDGAPPYIGGKFTTNINQTIPGVSSNQAKVWVENLAASLGLLITPAEVGFNSQSQTCPAAAVGLATTCTGYGQGGARVTDPNGIGKNPATGAGALTVPVKTQIANHVANTQVTTQGKFRDNDLIVVWAGHNDVLVQFGAFAASAADIRTQEAAGTITANQANSLLLNAQTAAQTQMKAAALELAGYVKTEILAKGGKYVVVMNLLDFGDTPFGNSPQVLPAKGVLSGLSEIFNLWLTEGLKNQPVQLVDAASVLKDVVASPATYGFVDVTHPACDATTMPAQVQGSSLFCNAGANLSAGATVATWLFADTVHPTTGGHAAISNVIRAKLMSFGWLPAGQ